MFWSVNGREWEREGTGEGAYREREEGVVLEENGDGTPEVVEFERPDVVSPKEDLALVGVVQARCQLEDGTLPGTVRADDNLFVLRSVRQSPNGDDGEQPTQSCPGRSLNEMFLSAQFSVSGYLNDTFLRYVRLHRDSKVR